MLFIDVLVSLPVILAAEVHDGYVWREENGAMYPLPVLIFPQVHIFCTLSRFFMDTLL